MTNERIILSERLDLYKEGKLAGTGRVFNLEVADGNTVTIEEPEQIHTYQRWKEMGFQVRKGETAVAKFPIWKYGTRKSEDDEGAEIDGEDADDSVIFMKKSAFFAQHQVEPIDESKERVSKKRKPRKVSQKKAKQEVKTPPETAVSEEIHEENHTESEGNSDEEFEAVQVVF